jgi:aminoglycoside phosphotransferase (APT) family kinase protein
VSQPVTTEDTPWRSLLDAAGASAGLRTDGATLIRDGSNVLYRLPDDIVARVGRQGRLTTARREVAVAQWLAEIDFPAIRAITGVEQPTVVGGHPVTWWKLLPSHRPATPAELGQVLRSLHSQSILSTLDLPELDPFDGIADRIENTSVLAQTDRMWLQGHLAELKEAYERLPAGLPYAVVHGDAWQGNVAVTDDGSRILLDFEHISVGRPEWDLVPVAADYADFERVDEADYKAFAAAYGWDVTAWDGFRMLADTVELRWVCFALAKAESSADAKQELTHRIACLRGEVERPWSWSAL